MSIGSPTIYAQEMDHSRPTVPSSQLTIRGLDGKSITLTPEDLAAMPHKTVSVYNEHTKASEKYAGVPLANLLAKANVPLGEKVRGQAFHDCCDRGGNRQVQRPLLAR